MKVQELLKKLVIQESLVNYNKLKNLIKADATHKEKETFKLKFERETQKVQKFIDLRLNSITERSKFNLTAVDCEKLKNEILNYSDFIAVNFLALKKIIEKFEKATGETMIGKELKRKIYEKKLHKIIKEIDIKEGNENKIDTMVSKFWIPSDNMTQIKLNLMQKLSKVNYVNNAIRLDDSIVSTVYLDNTSFSLYSSYLKKKKDSFFIRLRWYGTNAEIVYCEMLSNVNYLNQPMVSILKIPKRQVLNFINGNDVWESVLNIEDLEDEQYRNANSAKVNGSNFEVYSKIQKKILKYNLRPTIRTFFKRTIFENPEIPGLKINFDSNITMIKECLNYDFENDDFPLKSWARPEIGYNWPFRNLMTSEVIRFPYSVINIIKEDNSRENYSLPVDTIRWLEGILSDSNIEKVPNFSKFIHGCSMLYPITGLVPHWISQAIVSKQINGETIRKNPFYSGFVHIKDESQISYDLSPNSEEGINNEITVRVEPKTFYANERTFLKWIEFSIYAGGTGTAMLSIGNIHAYLFGVMMIAVTIVFSIYSLYLYHYRAIHIRLRHTVPYDDRLGPTVAISIFIFLMILAFILKFPIKKNGIRN